MKTYEQMAAEVLRRRDEAVALQAKKNKTTRMVATVAAVCLVTAGVTAGIWGGMVMNRPNDGTTEIGGDTKPTPEIPTEAPPTGSFWDDTRERKNLNIVPQESAIEWRWEDMTDEERYTNLEFDGKSYGTRGTVIGYLGEWLASGEAFGTEWGENIQRHYISCEIYSLTFSPDHSSVAVQFEGSSEIYRFECEREFDPPKTLGEFMETRKLSELLPLTYLYHTDYGIPEHSEVPYALSSEHSDGVWKILAKYADAPVEKDVQHKYTEKIGFSATSEILGTYNSSFRISDDGYIFTNIEHYGYHYHIGVDAAREVIDYVKAHMTEPLPEEKPTVYQIIGMVVEEGDGYIKVDDSIAMKNPEDGMVFTVITTDKKLSRVLKYLVGEGSTVLITYDGRVSSTSAEDPLLIENATSLQSVWIDGNGDAWIPE